MASFGPEVTHRVENDWDVWTVTHPNALTQIAGYLRFTTSGGRALYRGQSIMLPTMLPTALRPRSADRPDVSDAQLTSHASNLSTFVNKLFGDACKCRSEIRKYGNIHHCSERAAGKSGPIVSGTYRAAVEPLLQHYGIRTRWIDVVDNIWIALWFACHDQISKGRFAHHERRSPAQAEDPAYAYIYVFETGVLSDTEVPGYHLGSGVRLVDLRYCVPSVYLRPHAQHGLLLAPRTLERHGSKPLGSLASQVAGIIEVKLEDALTWLGSGHMNSTHVLFPPATRDEGYRRLLEMTATPAVNLGSITIYGPGI